jgi:molybdopterin-synthase adenylyltransferase
MMLTEDELERYSWQLDTPGYSVQQQQLLRQSTVLISRCGGVGGTAALHLAAAGVGRLILAHGGDLRLNDLNRQLLMTTQNVGQPRALSIQQTLHELNPQVELTVVPSNITEENADPLVQQADLVISAAPLFEERLRMNAATMRYGRPIIHAAMYDLSASVMVTRPGLDACLACITPTAPSWWKRRFPVFGAVSGTAASIAAMQAIQLLTGLGETLAGRLWSMDFRQARTHILNVAKDPQCPVCATGPR